MVKKIPPPVGIATKDPIFNRWLLELTNILNSAGEIDPGSVAGLAALTIQVTAQGAAITALQTSVGTLNGQVTALQTSVGTLNGQVTTLNGQVTALQARNQILNGVGAPGVGLGNNGDLYLNNTGGGGTRLYGKIGGAWVVIA